MQWLSLMLTLVLVLAQSTWTMLLAVVVRVTSLTVPVALLSDVIVILKMLELDVKVNYTAILSLFYKCEVCTFRYNKA